MKRVQEAYDRYDNRHLKKEMNPLLVGLKIIKRVQNAYDKDDNGYLKKEINFFINEKHV